LQHAVKDNLANCTQDLVSRAFLQRLAVEIIDAGKAAFAVVEALGAATAGHRCVLGHVFIHASLPVSFHAFLPQA
jgi:hypothetical protein